MYTLREFLLDSTTHEVFSIRYDQDKVCSCYSSNSSEILGKLINREIDHIIEHEYAPGQYEDIVYLKEEC